MADDPTTTAAGRDPWTPEGFTRLRLAVEGAGHRFAGHVTVLVCDDCGSMVGNTAAHRLLCYREERDGG